MPIKKFLLIATRRKGKLDEIRDFLGHLDFQLLTLDDLNFPRFEPQETGNSFEENAIIKAKFYGEKSNLLTMADDSGLLVDALPNKLGIRSKRYGQGTDIDRNQKLLNELINIPKEKRTAKFISVVTLFDPINKIIRIARGVTKGEIAFQPKGIYGFGYDPIFIVSGLNKHFAELVLQEKNQVSHRAIALKKIKKYLI